MSELNVYYHIVPKDDGYTFLCRNKQTGELYLHKKSKGRNPESLIFASRRTASIWLKFSGLLEDCFEVEEFGVADPIEEFADIEDLATLGYNFEVGM